MIDTKKFIEIRNNEIKLNTFCDGDGPLVIMIHGWPESWYSWRHQIKFFVQNGFKVAVPDMRGYGNSSKPHEIIEYDVMKLTSDVIAIANHLKYDSFNLIGHDWGGPVVWNTSLYYSNRVEKVCGMSVPHTVSQNSPIETMKFLFKDIFFYMLYFQKEGLVEKELEFDMRKSLLSVYGSLTSDGKLSETFEPKPFRKDMTFLESMGSIDSIPEFMTEKDFNFYLSEFEKNGMRGPINWYRNIDRNWEVTKNFHNKKIPSPTCFITGEDDPVGKWAPINPDHYDNLISSHIIKKAGHWVQQEKPDEVNKILLEFFK